MNQPANTLTPDQRRRFAGLEEVIARGIGAFMEVGRAFEEVRDRRLYRETHERFEDYARERWGFSKQHAYRLIAAADVADDVSPMGYTPESERQARPLVPLPPAQRLQVWEAAVGKAGGSQPTAAEVEALAREALESLPPAARLRVAEGEEGAARDRQEGRRQEEERDGRRELLGRIAFHLRQLVRLTRQLGPEGEGIEEGIRQAQRAHALVA